MPVRFTHTKRQRGFTLAEILVTTAIFAVIMIAALTVYDRSNRVFSSSTTAANTQQSTRIGFEKLVSDLRMAGFDYNRGGIPNGQGQYSQPDEQIEYAGATAVVFRGNFDYNIHPERSNGLATDGSGGTPNYYVTNTANQKIFPYITTDNSEIVAYVLRSTAPGAANGDSISFYADTDVPRRAYPNVAGLTSSGHAENQVTISGIDISNNNPPYTLYRVTVDDINNNRPGTPVAENLRSLNFTYYQDGYGSSVLTIPDGTPTGAAITATRNAGGSTVATSGTGAIGGDGQYNPNAANGIGAGNFGDRVVRTLIQSVRASVVGMDATPTANYQNPTETNPAFVNYREYTLSSLVVPRNLGLQGFPEPNFVTPGQPSITGWCTGHCAAPFITWAPPTSGGPVTIGYQIEWDVSQAGSFSDPHTMVIYDPAATSVIVKDCACDPSLSYFYRIRAINENGLGPASDPPVLIQPRNSTKPNPPTVLQASVGQTNQITLSWVAPTLNASATMSCSTASTSGTNIPPPAQEPIHFQVARGLTPGFTPNIATDLVLDYDTASQPAAPNPGATVTWVDGPAAGTAVQSLKPPAACVTYYYKVRALDRCYKSDPMNSPSGAAGSISDWSAVTNPGGQAASASTPATPTVMALDPDASKTQCPKLNGLCDIALNWNKVVVDTNNNPVAVDIYTLFRERRIQGTTTWSPDTTNGAGGMRDIAGFSNQAGSPVSFIDTNVAYQDLFNGLYEYRYSVAAKICSTPSPGFSNTTVYPGCNFSVAVTATGASSGSGSAGDPWILGYNDSIAVARTAGNQLAGITFQLMQNGTNVGSAVSYSGAGPYTYAWSDQPGGVAYELWIRMTDTAGCSMTYVRYINQQPPAACTFRDLGATGGPGGPPTPSLATSGSQPRSVTFDFAYSGLLSTNFAMTNNQPTVATTEAMKFNIGSGSPGGAFQGSMTIVWADVNGLHPELNFTSVDWIRLNSSGSPVGSTLTTSVSQALTTTTSSATINATQTTIDVASTGAFGNVGSTGILYVDSEAMAYTIASATRFNVTRGAQSTTAAVHTTTVQGNTTLPIDVEKQMTTTVLAPSGLPDIQPGESIEFVLHLTYDSSHKNTKLTTSGSVLRNICIKYKVLSDPGPTQSCNLVGRLANSVNPSSCD